MRCPIKEFLLSTVLLCALALTGRSQAPAPTPTRTPRVVPNFIPVTDQTMRAPKPEDWLIHRGNYQAWGYSPLAQINKANVKNLQLVWARTMEPGANESTPIVYNGVMYLGNPGDVIQAIDAATGDLIWEHRRTLPPVPAFRNALGLLAEEKYAEADRLDECARALREEARREQCAEGRQRPLAERLRYAAYTRCRCGAGMAYDLFGASDGIHDDGTSAADGYWECSAILLGAAVQSGFPGAVTHEARWPFAFYEIKSEDQPSAQGATTRLAAKAPGI